MPQHRSAVLFLLLAITAWGAATPIIKATVSYVPPFSFLMLRFWIAGLITIPLSIYYIKKYKINFTRAKHILISSGLGHIIALSLMFMGLEKTTAVEGSLLTSFSPLLVTIFGFLILKEIITKKEIEGTLIAFIGALIIVFEPIFTGHSIFNERRTSFIGNILFLVGIAFDGFYVIYVKKHLSNDKIVNPFTLVVLSFAFAAIFFTPLGILEQYLMIKTNQIGLIQSILSNLDRYLKSPALYGILYMAIISGLFGYAFFQFGLKYIEASKASVYYYLQPLIGIPIAIILLNEDISWLFIIGAILIIVGIFIAERSDKTTSFWSKLYWRNFYRSAKLLGL